MLSREPAFYRDFRCLGGACPLTCCRDWDIVVDKESLADYATAPEGLRQTIAAALITDEEGDVCFRLASDGRCALLDEDGLCPIQRRWGEEHLCEHCASYPRFIEEYGCLTEACQAVSCPEAARLVLDEGIFPLVETDDGSPDAPFEGVDGALLAGLTASRSTAFALLTDADRPLWGRLAGLLDYADALQKHIDCGDVRTMEVVSPPPLTRSGTGNGLQPMAVRLLELLARLDPLRPEWPALLHARAGELAALSPEQYQARTGRFHAAQPQWDVHLERLACYLVFRHWPKAVNDDGLYPRAALTAAACLALHHLALLAWNDAPSFSDGDEALLWARFSREVEHDEANFFALAEALADLEQWPLAQIFQQ